MGGMGERGVGVGVGEGGRGGRGGGGGLDAECGCGVWVLLGGGNVGVGWVLLSRVGAEMREGGDARLMELRLGRGLVDGGKGFGL